MYSHHNFAKRALQEVNNIKPDILYVIAPPNTLLKQAAKYKKKNNVKLYFDIIDLWPETLPIKSKIKNLLHIPLKMWSNLRDKNLTKADAVITECNLYQKILNKKLEKVEKHTVYVADNKYNTNVSLRKEQLDICYLGSINNIVDVDFICKIVKHINEKRKVKFHIIGDGEKREELVNYIKNNKIDFEYYGKIYDDERKARILEKCYFGINIMKDNVCVGLTMKSIEYFKFGLPIINNIKADTYDVVEKYSVGYNINNGNFDEIISEISNIDGKKNIEMRQNVSNMFDELFTVEKFKDKIKHILKI